MFLVYHYSNSASNLSVDSKEISHPLKPTPKVMVSVEDREARLCSLWVDGELEGMALPRVSHLSPGQYHV